MTISAEKEHGGNPSQLAPGAATSGRSAVAGTGAELSGEQLRAVQAKLLLDQAKALGLELEDLLVARDGGTLPGRVTFHDYLPTVRRAAKPGSVHVYDSYWPVLDEGLPAMCACLCDACLDAGAPVPRPEEGTPATRPCPCTARGACACAPAHFGHPAVTSCLERYPGIGNTALAEIVGTDIEEAQRWVKVRAEKRWTRRNRKRATIGRAQFKYTGKAAEEHLREAASAVLRRALADPSTGVVRNVALDAPKPSRPKTTARAYTTGQMEELWDAIFTCGLADPELAMLLVWWHLETGSRRGGAIGLLIGDLDLTRQYATLLEKGEKVGEQPMSVELQRSIVGHALGRGDVILSTVKDLRAEDVTVDDVVAGRATLRPDAPAFYYKRTRAVTLADGTVRRAPHPLTRRHYNTVWDRLCAVVPWADQIHARPHDLRKTGAVWIERALGFSVAKSWLRHKVDEETLTYTTASPEEVARAFEVLTGRTHPRAEAARSERRGRG